MKLDSDEEEGGEGGWMTMPLEQPKTKKAKLDTVIGEEEEDYDTLLQQEKAELEKKLTELEAELQVLVEWLAEKGDKVQKLKMQIGEMQGKKSFIEQTTKRLDDIKILTHKITS